MRARVSLIAVFAGLWLSLAGAVQAVEPNERLADPALEARARGISEQLRCLVCQNETIDDSHADLAHDLRVLVRERLTAGDTDAQAIAFITARYGDFVLLKPPMRGATLVLWFGPLTILVLGGIGTIIWFRRRKSGGAEEPAPLSDMEKSRLKQMMAEGES